MSGPATQGGEDPSMEDILASIRRILSEDEAAAAAASTGAEPPETRGPDAAMPHDVLALDESMLVREPGAAEPALPEERPVQRPEQERRVALPETQPNDLVAPEAAAATAASMGALMRTLTGGRPQPLQVTRAGVTLEDIVRDELRPIVKAWLDEHLPPLVERLVRAEIERVVGRATDL